MSHPPPPSDAPPPGVAAVTAFDVDSHYAFVAAPPRAAAPPTPTRQPWVWYAPTLRGRHPGPHESWMFERLHAAGVAVAGVDVGESYGSPAGRAVFHRLYLELTEQRGFSTRPVLLARSRGGLQLYNWAAEHPHCVAAIAGIYPVCNLTSYPGIDTAAPAYGVPPQALRDALDQHNPVDRLAPLARAGVPLFHRHGDADHLVPFGDHTALLAARYAQLGGPIHVDRVPGGGHDLSPHWFTAQALVDFAVRHAQGNRAATDRRPGPAAPA